MATNNTKNDTGTFSDFEKQAMRDRAKELRAEAKAGKNRAIGEAAVAAAINAMVEPDKSLAKKVDELVKKTAPQLFPKTWYGMPAYANADGKVICFFQSGHKYESRFCSFGFSDTAKLDEGNMWPTTFALINITAKEESRIIELVKKAIE